MNLEPGRAAALFCAWAALAAGAATTRAATSTVTATAEARTPTPAPDPGDWPALGNDPGGSQYSPLAQIDTGNVARLQLAWVHRSGDVAARGSAVGATALEAVPIHVNDTLYYCTALNRVFALDPSTGRERWVFDPHAARAGAKALVAAPRKAGICRGVAYWQAAAPRAGTPCEKRIFKGDVHGHVFAIDADTGAACRDFGAAAGHPGYVTHSDFDARGTNDTARGSTSPPVVVGDLVVATAGARDSLSDANNGFVRAFDVRSGELRWAFDPIPPQHAHDTGAANAWSTLSVDPQRGLVFVPTTSPSSDYYGVNRLYDIPLADATVALSVRTGEPVWHFQATRHDLFDFDLPGHPLLVDILHRGRRVPVAIQQTKQGRVFVLDRDTGRPLFPVEERPAPRSDIPGERAAPTQPYPVLPEGFSRQRLTEDDMWGLTPLDRAWCRREFRKLRYEGPFTPPSERGSLVFPFGGGNWGGVAYHPGRNLLVAKGQNLALRVTMIPKAAAGDPPRGTDLVGTPYRVEMGIFTSPLGIPCTPPPFGTVSAIDMDSGKLRWQVPLGQARYKGVTAPRSFGWGSPNIGGPIVTAGGLVFIGAALDARLRALDLASGRELWQAPLEAPGMSVPMTYLARGRQYVVIAAGGNARLSPELSDALMAFALPGAPQGAPTPAARGAPALPAARVSSPSPSTNLTENRHGL
ncbi:MAG: pyrroloquinoline quinone-dependent dehydrogenase [Steroidobacteraceae bacterium]|jgi:quinoprotein glucose dehydrogenase|nr:pyrroloquinoline quinone-dependent dehydrogenase [Steroidobacteraceae bacterium]